ncbi:MAG: deoxyguanosinetriphosphate triphosphohydrolase [Desulfobulbaceae bacterium A2]|nr:MAG: deoxyguanosinetriphosphate triphosphohydrolase [Desulfobulbaceae bacterium A2]
MSRTIRQMLEQREREYLAPYACLSAESRGRLRPEQDDCDLRTVFQRDRDRILHTKTFRRLKHKTQVFLAPAGDHYRTRLTHVLEVSQIARTVAVGLRLNEYLAEAIALGHDLGHTPFGHAGETMLNQLHPGGFKHYIQSLRVVDVLENRGKGLNLTWEVRNGIVKHSKGQKEVLPQQTSEMPATMEGQVVRLADIMAYVNHDLDDAIRAGLLQEDDVPEEIRRVVGDNSSCRIDAMVRDLVEETIAADEGRLRMSGRMLGAVNHLRAFLYERVYRNERVHNEFVKAQKIIHDLYAFFLEHEFPDSELSPCQTHDFLRRVEGAGAAHRCVCDFIAGMTDRYALDLFTQIFVPRPWGAF